MERKDRIDTAGAVALTAFAVVLAFNQVVIKVSNGGFQPVFAAGLRSVFGAVLILGWVILRRKRLQLSRETASAGLLIAAFFTFEFICLYNALDLTTVARASILFYSMPIVLALFAHFFLPGERLTWVRMAGLVLAMGGVIVALVDRPEGGQASLLGDLLALGAALGWCALALTARMSKLKTLNPETQLFYQLGLSIPMLLVASLFFGPLTRDPQLIHWAGLAFQSIAVASFGYLIWFVLLGIYPASGVASFSFLSPVVAVLLGWLLLGEDLSRSAILALGLVAVGLVLINRKGKAIPPR